MLRLAACEVMYRDDAAPAAHKPMLKRLDEVDTLEVPDPYTTFPMCEVHQGHAHRVQ